MREWPTFVILSSISFAGVSTSIATMSVRGTMTSWTGFSEIVRIEVIIRCSRSGRTPCACPVSMSSLISSSVTSAPLCGAPPNGPVMIRVRKKSTPTSGRVAQVTSSSGQTSTSRTACACRAPIARGAKRPKSTATRESTATVTTTAATSRTVGAFGPKRNAR